MSWILLDTGDRGWTKREDSAKRWPAMLDGYFLFDAGRVDEGSIPSGARTPLAEKPAGWDDLVALLPDVTMGRREHIVAVARVLLAGVIA